MLSIFGLNLFLIDLILSAKMILFVANTSPVIPKELGYKYLIPGFNYLSMSLTRSSLVNGSFLIYFYLTNSRRFISSSVYY